jgi:chitin synthase
MTRVVSNTLLIYIMTKDVVSEALFGKRPPNGVTPYLSFLFWTVAAMSVFRFVFSTLYLLQHLQDKTGRMFSSRR